jgi:LacI family transcriptional regulator
MTKRLPRVALLIESSRNYGRGILRGIANYSHAHGPWSFYTQERELHSGIPDWVKSWQGDGIIARIEDRRVAAQLLKLNCPVVDVLGQMRFPEIPGFDTDARAVARLAADFFLKAGFNHFAFSGYAGIPFSDRRGAAFSEYLAQKGKAVLTMPSATNLIGLGHIQAIEQQGVGADEVTAEWLRLQPRPLAVFACNDVRAQQILNLCREKTIRVPEDVAVMGVDCDDVLCNLCEPPLTSIEPDTERMGYEAAEALAQLMAGHTRPAPFTLIPPLRMVERASTDVIAMDDPIMAQAVRYIRNEVGNGISVKDVLSHVGRSRTDLEQRFRRWLGTSIRVEIQRRRLDRVCRLLQETDWNLELVATRAGFATAAHLCRLFQEQFQLTPTQFRKRGNTRQTLADSEE